MVYLPLNWIGQALDVAIKAFNVQKDNIDTQIVKLQWAYNTLYKTLLSHWYFIFDYSANKRKYIWDINVLSSSKIDNDCQL